MITGRQISAARALLKMSQADLAERSNISIPTLKRMEASDEDASGLPNNVAAVKATLEKSGICFMREFDTATGPGVCYDPSVPR